MVSEDKTFILERERRTIIRAYIAAFRPDYWFKNAFTMVGMVCAIVYAGVDFRLQFVPKLVLGLALSCLISSVGYVVNEVLDASFDALHPVKKDRPIPSGIVNVDILLLLNTGLLVFSLTLSVLFFEPVFSVLLMMYLVSAALYNMPPVRLKDRPYLDILNESSSSPIRFLLGWFCLGQISGVPPIPAILLVWIFGGYIMTGKRLAELRYLSAEAVRYRESFRHYSERKLMGLFLLCGAASFILFMLLGYVYRPRVLWASPLILVCFAWFFGLTVQKDSLVQQPETIIRKPLFLGACILTLVVIVGLII